MPGEIVILKTVKKGLEHQKIFSPGARHGFLRAVHQCGPVERSLRDHVRRDQRHQADEVLHEVH